MPFLLPFLPPPTHLPPPHPQAAVFTYESPETQTPTGEWVATDASPELALGVAPGMSVKGKVVYFVRGGARGVNEKNPEQDLLFCTFGGEAIDTFRALVSDVFVPVLNEQNAWGKNSAHDTQDFLHLAQKFSNTLNTAVRSIH